MIQQTSLEAFESMKLKLTERRKAVLEAIHGLGVCTDKDIAKKLNWTINRITPRRGELFRAGKICFIGFKQQDGQKVMTWTTR